jgi:DNA-binding IclR family transcriptional regulator
MRNTRDASGGDSPRPPYLVESVENALRILLKLKNSPELRVTEVSDELGIARSSAHRLLSTLVHMGFLRHDPIRRIYVPGTVLVELALASTGHRHLRQVAMPYLENLATAIEWTVHLCVLEGNDIRFVDGAESPTAVRVTARVGSRFPAHSTSSGKVLLASLPRKHLAALYPEGPSPVTDHTIHDIDALTAELDRVAAEGYATNLGENEIGLHAVAVPIRTQAGIPAAIAAAKPASASTEAEMADTVTALRAVAAAIADQLSAS